MREVELVFDDMMVLPQELLGVGLAAKIDLPLDLVGQFPGGLNRRDVPSLALVCPAERFADPFVSKEEGNLLAFEAEG